MCDAPSRANTRSARRGPTLTELAYLAGFFDGEGYVGFLSRSINVSVSNTNYSILEEFLKLFGGIIRRKNFATRTRRSAFEWRIYGAHAAKFLSTISPFLREKRPQAELALSIPRGVVRARGPLIAELKRLKRIDHDSIKSQ